MLEVSYRQTSDSGSDIDERAKGCSTQRGKRFEPREAREIRRKVLQLIREKYSGRKETLWAHTGRGTFSG